MRKSTKYVLWCDSGYLGTWYRLDELLEYIQQGRNRQYKGILHYPLTIEHKTTIRKEFFIDEAK